MTADITKDICFHRSRLHLPLMNQNKQQVPDAVSEHDLQKSIIRNLKDFILEIGKDFTFIGEEYRVQVGNHDYYIDLLFSHRGLSCFVAFELKIGEFKPE